jgi:hypothetical protein
MREERLAPCAVRRGAGNAGSGRCACACAYARTVGICMQHVRVRAVDILIVMFLTVTHDWVAGMVGMVGIVGMVGMVGEARGLVGHTH